MITNNRRPDLGPDCCTPQLNPGNRSDIISFISDSVGKDLWMTGSIEVHLFVSSTANATAFTIKVMELFANGNSINIVDDITDIRWINDVDVENYMPGSVRELTFKMMDISWKINSDSKVRIDVSSSNFPYYNVHPNLDKIWSETSEKVIANQTIYMGGNYPSRIILPIMENENKNKNKSKTILIVGATILAISIILITCLVVFLCYKKESKIQSKVLYIMNL